MVMRFVTLARTRKVIETEKTVWTTARKVKVECPLSWFREQREQAREMKISPGFHPLSKLFKAPRLEKMTWKIKRRDMLQVARTGKDQIRFAASCNAS